MQRMKTKKALIQMNQDQNHGIPTARGYNAPCFEGMVHYSMGLVLMHRDNEDGKNNVKSAYRTV